MIETQTAQINREKINLYYGQPWLSVENEQHSDEPNPDPIGQKVFSRDQQLVGLTTKLFLNPQGQISHLAIQTRHLFGQHKIVPILAVGDITRSQVQLLITRKQFNELPDYQDDSSIADEVDQALWKDKILRNSDYRHITVQVQDAIITLFGSVLSSAIQLRAETAMKNIPGSLGFKSCLFADDKLLLKVTEALIQIEHIEGSHVRATVQNGMVVLSGHVLSPTTRGLAEQCASNVAWVRGVINNVVVTGIILQAEDQRFLQPAIGKNIYFGDGVSGIVRQVVINRDNRRVVAIIIQGRFPEAHFQIGPIQAGQPAKIDRLVVIPVSVIRYLTDTAGFLLIDSTETTRYQDFDGENFVIPDADWVPPFPYYVDDVRFLKSTSLALAS